MDEICYDKVVDFVRKGHQVMVFVHARNATVKTAMALMETAKNCGDILLFEPDTSSGANGAKMGTAKSAVAKSRSGHYLNFFSVPPCCKKLLIGFEGKPMTPGWGKHSALLFLPASPSQTLKGLFELTKRP